MVFQPIGADNVSGALPPKVLAHLETLFSNVGGDTYDDTAIRSLITEGDEDILGQSKLYTDGKVATIPAGPQGPKGDTGNQGPIGQQGPIGPEGPPVAVTIDQKAVTELPSTYPTGISIMPISSGTGWPAQFATVETVRFGVNRSYQTIVERTTGRSWRRTPDANDTGWLPWIEWGAQGPQGIQGTKGDQGIQGIPGAAASITSATASTGLPGSAVSVALGGTSNARTFEFTIPRGEQGAQGLKGDKGDQGAQGIQGTTGTSASITGVTVSTGNAGTAASVSMGGTSTARTFAFTIPRGDQGLQGLKGDKGDPGVPGADGTGIQITGSVSTMSQLPTTGNTTGDAYIANDTGLLHVWGGSSWGAGVQFRGPEGPQGLQGIQGVKGDTGNQGIQGVKGDKGDAGTPGIQGIQGVKGDKGDTGNAGTPATITAVSASTGVAGSAASVSMAGTASARTFAFTIPRGDTGLTGADGPKGDKGDQGIQGIPGIQGDQGIQGIQGVAGTAAAITGATASTGLPGSNVSVSVGGTNSARTFAFTIPRGDKGDKGDKGDPGDDANVDLTPYARKDTLTINVKDFGATGDGTTNDEASINSAITALIAKGGGTLFFPEGKYIFHHLSIVGDNITILGVGNNSILAPTYLHTDNIQAIRMTGNNVGISKVFIQVQNPFMSPQAGFSNYEALRIGGPNGGFKSGALVDQVKFYKGGGCNLYRTTNATIRNCEYIGSHGNSFGSVDVQADALIIGNKATDGNDDLIAVTCDANVPGGTQRVVVANNILARTDAKAICTSGVASAVISDNHCEDTRGPAIQVFQDSAFGLEASQRVNITGNIVIRGGTWFGADTAKYMHTTAHQAPHGVHIAGVDINLSNNTIMNTYGRGIQADGVHRFKITENSIDTAGQTGITVGNPDLNEPTRNIAGTISSNTISRTVSGLIVGAASQLEISNNRITGFDSGSTGETRGLYYGYIADSIIHNNTIINTDGANYTIRARPSSVNPQTTLWNNNYITPGGTGFSGTLIDKFGMVVQSPNGTHYKIAVTDDGSLTTTTI